MVKSMDISERFEAVDDDYIKFNLVDNKRNGRPDLHAFLLLDELFPNKTRDMVCGSSHDVIYLDVASEEIETLSDEHILELTRCGVMYSGDGLSMFT